MERNRRRHIADSARMRLRPCATTLQARRQIKLVRGGWVSSPRTTLDMMTFTSPIFAAGVEAAADRNTYSAAHAISSRRD